KTFTLWSGYFNIASGILMFLFWYLYAILLPYGQLSSTLSLLVLNKNWTFVNILGALGALLGIVGLVGLFISIGDKLGNFATLGFIIALLGSILMFIALMRDTLLWPILANHDPSLLDFSGPIYTSKTFMPFFIFSGVLYTLGFVIFGFSIAGSGLYPAWAGHLLAWGALLFGLGAAFGEWQVIIRSIGITALSISLVWLGYLMKNG
ncbi:MAG TPA: hypothetical protein VLA72_21130, partial [Anaerolineales bacterium]|nr:hypothetical protein [Anaerolineales bacterium]